MIAPTQYLRAGRIAEMLGISVRTVRRRIADRTLPSVKVGGARLVAEADLLKFLRGSTDAETVDDKPGLKAQENHGSV